MSFPAAPPQAKRRGNPEASLQITVVDYLRRALPPPCVVWFCPNGGNLSKSQAERFRRMGLLSGVHDLHLIWPGGFGTLEMKRPDGKGRMSGGQVSFARDMTVCGHRWAEVNSLELARDTVNAWLAEAGLELNPRIYLVP